MVSAFQQSIDSLSSRLELSNVENERKAKEVERMKIILLEGKPQGKRSTQLGPGATIFAFS